MQSKKNEICYTLSYCLYTMSFPFINGIILQNYMVEFGVAESKVAFYVSVAQVFQLMTMLLFSKATDGLTNAIKVHGIMRLLILPMYILLAVFCLLRDVSADLLYLLVFGIGGAANLVIGFDSIVSYKVPAFVMSMERYGVLTAIGAAVGGIGSVLITTCMSFSQQKYAYFDMMAFFFAIAAIFALLSGVFILQLKKINTVENTLQAERRKINLLKYKPFTAMILPNLLRGFCAGAFGIMAAIGYYFDILDSTTSGYMAVIANAAAFGSCCLFALSSKRGRANNKWIVLFSSIVMAVLMPAMLITESVWVFLLLYGVAYIGFNSINLAVPVAVYKIVDYQLVGEYSAWRMLLHTLGSAIAGMVCIPLFEAVGGVAVLTAVGGMQLISGIIYYGVEYCADKKGVGI